MILPNNQSLRSIAAGLLWLPHLFTPLRVYIFRDTDLRRSLFGLAPLCAQGCHVSFTNTTATVSHNGNIVLSGHRLDPQLLWTFNLPAALAQTMHSTASAHAAMSISSDAAFVRFAHTSLGSPSNSTLLRALNAGYLNSFPRLAARLLQLHPLQSIATAKGHLDQHRQGLDSTADHPSSPPVATPPDPVDSPHTVYVKTILASDTSHSDLTGRFPIQSTSGQQYLFISTMDGYIHAEPMTSRHHTEYVKAYQKIIDFFPFPRSSNFCSTPRK